MIPTTYSWACLLYTSVDRPHPLHSLSLYLSALQQYCVRQLLPSGLAPKLSVPPGGERPSGSKQSKNPSGGLSLPRCLHLREYLRYIEPALLQHHPLHRAEGPEDAEFCGGRRNHQRGRENHPLGLETVTQRNAPGQKSGGPSTLPVLAAKERLIHQFVSSASWAKALSLIHICTVAFRVHRRMSCIGIIVTIM